MAEPVRLPLITNSRAKSFRRCARHHLISYQQGIRPIEKAGPLGFGGIFHKMLESWWLASELKLGRPLPRSSSRTFRTNSTASGTKS